MVVLTVRLVDLLQTISYYLCSRGIDCVQKCKNIGSVTSVENFSMNSEILT